MSFLFVFIENLHSQINQFFLYFIVLYCFVYQGYSVLTKVSSHARRNHFAPHITKRKSDVTSLLLTSLCIQIGKVFAREYSPVYRKIYIAKIICTFNTFIKYVTSLTMDYAVLFYRIASFYINSR